MAYKYELLPPLVQDVLKPFTDDYVKKYDVKFYFSVGNNYALNSKTNGNINTIQIMIQRQNTSNNVYYSPQYELIQVRNDTVFNLSSSQQGDHCVEIPRSGKHFSAMGFYKIKMRWSKKTISYFEQNGIVDEDFSEWSKLSLIKQIRAPYLHISSPFVDNEEDENTVKQISFSPYKITGYIDNEDKSETVKSVNITIKNLSTNKIIIRSGEIAPYNRTGFSYTLTKELQQSIRYEMKINYTLQSGFSAIGVRKFISISRGANNNPATISLAPVDQQGKMQVIVLIPTYERYEGNFIIRRTDSNSKFSEWEDIKVIQFISQGDNKNTIQYEINNTFYDVYIWEDKTVNCGIYYKYGIAPLKKGGWRGTFVKTSLSQACFFDDIYLMGNNKQLRIKFDPVISNFKQNFTENLQTTLGSQYPFITRNGANNYKSFTFGGLITTYMDTYNNHNLNLYNDSLGTNRNNELPLIFVGKTDYFGRLINPLTNQLYYDLYNNTININQISHDENGFLTYSNGGRIFNKIDGTAFQLFASVKFPSKSVMQSFQAFDSDDEIKDFTSKEQLFNGGYSYEDEEDESPKTKLEIYNQEQGIDQYEDVIYERTFRDKVLKFLYQNSIKLFRSNTEGVILVRLMNISLTPKQELGRMLYSFTADAIEMDKYSAANCDKYNIQNIGSYKTIQHIETVAGTLTTSFFYEGIKPEQYDEKIQKYLTINQDGSAEIDIIKLIKDKYRDNWKYQPCVPTSQKQMKKIKAFHNMYDFTGETFKSLKIEICSPPNLIVDKKYWTPEIEQSTSNPTKAKQAIRGYLLKLDYKNNNPKTIIIKSHLQRRDAYISPEFANNVSNNHNNPDNHNYTLIPDIYNPGDGLQARDNKFIYVGTYVFQQMDKLEKLLILLPKKDEKENKNNPSFITLNISYTIELDICKYDSIPIQSNIKPNVGQLTKTFKPNQDIIKEIKNNYYFYLGNSILDKNMAVDSNAIKYESLNINDSNYQLVTDDWDGNGFEYINSYGTIMQKTNKNKLSISSVLTTLREISNVLAISFDTEINAVVEVETTNFLGTPNQASTKHQHILNMGYLKLSDLDNSAGDIHITKCQFKGIYLAPTSKVPLFDGNTKKFYSPNNVNKHSYYPRPGEYIFIGKPSQINEDEVGLQPGEQVYSSKKEVERLGHLIENGVYIIHNSSAVHYNEQNNETLVVNSNAVNNNALIASPIPDDSSWIWHKGKWYPFSESNSGYVECPVDAIVNYIYEGGITTYQLVES